MAKASSRKTKPVKSAPARKSAARPAKKSAKKAAKKASPARVATAKAPPKKPVSAKVTTIRPGQWVFTFGDGKAEGRAA